MDDTYLKSLKPLDYAKLSSEEEAKLRQLEKSFNTEYGEDYYFMVMKRSNEK